MTATPEKRTSRPVWLRVLLSIFIVYHLIVISVLANGGSFLGRKLGPWISPYGNLFGVNVVWNFFAPDPAHTMYIHYVVHFLDSEEGTQLDPVEGFIPPEKEKIVVNTSKRRFLYAMRSLIFDEKRMKVFLGPFLCRQHPGADSIVIKNILEPIPSLDLVQLNSVQEKQQATLLEYTHDCQEVPDEVAL